MNIEKLSMSGDSESIGTTLSDYRKIVVSADVMSEDLSVFIQNIEKFSEGLVRVLPFERALEIVRKSSKFKLFCIFVDYVGGPGVVVPSLLKFRVRQPHVPILLLSRDFGGDDLTTERLSICDVSLRLPVDEERFMDSVQVASKNIIEWKKRLSER